MASYRIPGGCPYNKWGPVVPTKPYNKQLHQTPFSLLLSFALVVRSFIFLAKVRKCYPPAGEQLVIRHSLEVFGVKEAEWK